MGEGGTGGEVGRSRWRGTRAGLLGGVVVLGAVLVVGRAVSGSGSASETPIATHSPGAVASPGPTLPPGAGTEGTGGSTVAPAEIVALSGGSVAVLDTATGRVVRRLATHPETAAGGFPYLQGLTLTPDHGHVYYALAGDCGLSTIFSVPFDGSTPPEVVAEGVSPAVSPDGRTLAYATASPSVPRPPDGTRCQNAVVVRNLATGVERMWAYPNGGDYDRDLYRQSVITEIAWAPDSTRLAYTLSYEGNSVAVLDTASHTDLGQTAEVVIPGGGGDSRHPAWQKGSGLLAVFNTAFECCYDDDYRGPPRALLVDPATRVSKSLLPAGRRVTWLAFDASGSNLLFVDGGRLYRRRGTAEPRPVATGVTAAVW